MLVAWIFIAIAAALAARARLPFAPTLRYAAFALFVPVLLFGVVEEVLERLGWIDKQDKRELDEGVALLPKPKPVPISVPAELDPYAEAEKPTDETTLTPLGGGALPAKFDRGGRKAVWRVEDPPRD